MVSLNVRPTHYDLWLKPDLKTFEFQGRTTIKLNILEPVKEIILNAADLTFTSNSVSIKIENKTINANEVREETKDETFKLTFPEDLPVGEGHLSLDYTGELNDQMKGFYRSKYFVKGETRYAAVTQFCATDARRCFPGWDAPEFKATYDITLVVPKDLVALSNMPVVSDVDEEGGLRTVKFDRTPIMSSYLVAVVVGEFDYIEDKSSDGVLVRVYTPLNSKNQGTFALKVATKVLPYYKEYFNIGFPLPKLDLIAIPDLSYGAMENWGLITYREQALLVDPANTSLLRKQQVVLTVSHEIAHQWFGNLVTMKWWTHLWLNEGYASFTEFLCTHHLFPEYDIWTQFATDMGNKALELDSLRSSHPIEVEVKHPNEINEIFDKISYNKGASIIRMLYNYIGDEDFRKGMNHYLTQHQYKNTETEDLWKAFSESASKPVTEMMKNWVQKTGYPVVRVLKNVQDGDKRILTLSQQRFIADGGEDTEKTLWMIPIQISTPSNRKAVTTIFDKEQMEITIEGVKEGDWIKINPDSVGFYRVQYLPELLETFVKSEVIHNQVLPALDRLALLDDLFALIQAGKVSTVEALKLLDAYRDEGNYTVWEACIRNLQKLQIILSHTDFGASFDKFCVELLAPVAEKLGWTPNDGENHLDTLLRPLVLSSLVSSGCEKTINTAIEKFKVDGNNVPADLQKLVYKAVMQNADESTWNKMHGLYNSARNQDEQGRIASAFGASHDEKILRKALEFSISLESRSIITVQVITSAATNPTGREIAWEFFKKNCSVFRSKLSAGFLLSALVKTVTENFASDAKANEVEKFFKINEFPTTERSVKQAVETIRMNAAWLTRDRESIKEFLQKY